jgi:hypothetical protein
MLIVLAAAILCLPVLLAGIPESGDAATHARYQYYFTHQFWSGDLYPRWLADENKGYGSPIFLAQYSFPYFATALLRPLTWFKSSPTRESRELGIYCFLVLAAAGLAARTWFRNRYTPAASTIAAIAYIAFPYIVGQTIYDRVSVGELATFLWMPWILALIDRIQPTRFRVLSAIGLLFALLILSNVLTSVLFAPLMILYALVSGYRTDKSPVRRAAPLLISFAVGVGTAAAYLFPLAAYRRLFDAGAVSADHPYFELGRQLLNITSGELSSNRIIIPGIICAICLILFIARYIWRSHVNRAGQAIMLAALGLGAVMLIPGAGKALIDLAHLKVSGDSYNAFSAKMLLTDLFTFGLGLLAYCRVSKEQTDPRERLLLSISCGALVLMLPWSSAIWKTVPGLGAILQFPWRLGALLTVAAAGLFASAIDDCMRRGSLGGRIPSITVLISVALVTIVPGNLIWRVDARFRAPSSPQVDLTRGVDPMYPTYVPPSKLAAFAKDVGTTPDTWEVASTPVVYGVRADLSGGQGTVSAMRVGPRRLLVSAQSTGFTRALIGQLYFPLWRIVPTTQSTQGELLGSSADDLIEVSLTPGRHDFELVFDGGWPERLGNIVTLTSVLLVLGGFLLAALTASRRKSIAEGQCVTS